MDMNNANKRHQKTENDDDKDDIRSTNFSKSDIEDDSKENNSSMVCAHLQESRERTRWSMNNSCADINTTDESYVENRKFRILDTRIMDTGDGGSSFIDELTGKNWIVSPPCDTTSTSLLSCIDRNKNENEIRCTDSDLLEVTTANCIETTTRSQDEPSATTTTTTSTTETPPILVDNTDTIVEDGSTDDISGECPKETDSLHIPDPMYGSLEDVSCFPMFSCCRRSSRQKDCYSSTSSMFGSDLTNRPTSRPKPYQDYVKISQSSSVSSNQSHGSIQTSCSMLTASDISSARSFLSSNGSSFSDSQDSGCFEEEPPCLLNLVFLDHKCRGVQSCRKTKYRNLNVHLKHLTTCMPQPFSESRENTKYNNLQKAPYLSRRRHAICETSEEMRALFCEALNSFLTLQAMVKYDFL